jgi:predicted anti-sigma-YlaC factor YlaD
VNLVNFGKNNPPDHQDEWAADLLDYSEGRLNGAELTRVEAHLKECPTCAGDAHALSDIAGMLGQLPVKTAPRSFVIDDITARRLKKTQGYYRLGWLATAAAALVLMAVVGLDAFGALSTPEQVAGTPLTQPSPTVSLPAVGTVAGASANGTQGAIAGSGAASVTPTAAQPSVASAAKTVYSTPLAVRLLEIGLVITVMLFVTFTFAVRPRSPGRNNRR